MEDEHVQADLTKRDPLEELRAGSAPGLVRELVELTVETRKWWLVPILIAIVLFGVLVYLGSTGVAPFTYTLF